MLRPLCGATARAEDAPAPHPACRKLKSTLRRSTMTWQTPQATDLRFGFEITMYVAAR